MASVMVFTGNANPELTNQIARSLGISISNALVDLYSDGEINIEIKVNVRGNDVFIVQPICLPTNRNVMELVLMIDALRRHLQGVLLRSCLILDMLDRTGESDQREFP
ncbi:MAG: hypothetical protein CM15mP51_10760 [Porticoccaceae bacterium]|nr:MAG: hypothetical protein CM15mP51_10760 [Porticoccaceae bacterium]